MTTNLPKVDVSDSAEPTKLFFDTYGIAPLEFRAVDVDSTITFFKSRGFTDDAAISTASVLLKQAKLDNMAINKLLDTLKGFDDLQISSLVGEIMNNNRLATSTLGYRSEPKKSNSISRNVLA
jgi:hypothetical protein